jgi:hypothetical protein
MGQSFLYFRLWSYGFWRLVVLEVFTNVSEKCSPFFPDDEAMSSSETLVTTYKTTWYRNPEDHNTNFYRRENLKSQFSLLASMSKPFLRLTQSPAHCVSEGLSCQAVKLITHLHLAKRLEHVELYVCSLYTLLLSGASPRFIWNVNCFRCHFITPNGLNLIVCTEQDCVSVLFSWNVFV